MEKRIVEINGVKLEIDLSSARVVDEYKVGDSVKVLVKEYQDYKSYPGVIVGFESFKERPCIVIAYVKVDYSTADIRYVYLNGDTKDVEICPMLENEIQFDKARVIDLLDRQITKAEEELNTAKSKKAYFEREFGRLFKDA